MRPSWLTPAALWIYVVAELALQIPPRAAASESTRRTRLRPGSRPLCIQQIGLFANADYRTHGVEEVREHQRKDREHRRRHTDVTENAEVESLPDGRELRRTTMALGTVAIPGNRNRRSSSYGIHNDSKECCVGNSLEQRAERATREEPSVKAKPTTVTNCRGESIGAIATGVPDISGAPDNELANL